MIQNPVYAILFLLIACHSNEQQAKSLAEGGYPFPKEVTHKEFPHYPIKDAISSNDSFIIANYWSYLYKAYNEPNLSLSPSKSTIARFVYFGSGFAYTTIITLIENELRIKQVVSGSALPFNDEDKLDSLERNHFYLFKNYFPIDQYNERPGTKRFLDSLTKVYPKLLEPTYYRNLWNKTLTIEEPFTYKEWSLPISKAKAQQIIENIISSGYWQMKPKVQNCSGDVTHPDYIFLEVATPEKYNYVDYMLCDEDSSKFAKLCEELIQITKVDENRTKWTEEFIQKNLKNQ